MESNEDTEDSSACGTGNPEQLGQKVTDTVWVWYLSPSHGCCQLGFMCNFCSLRGREIIRKTSQGTLQASLSAFLKSPASLLTHRLTLPSTQPGTNPEMGG